MAEKVNDNTFEQDLEIIRTEPKGKDIRMSIHDAFVDVNEYVDKAGEIAEIQSDLAGLETKVNKQQDRIDSFFPETLRDGGFDSSLFVDGYLINTSTGSRNPNSNYSASVYISLDSLEEDADEKRWIAYTRLHTTGTSALFGIAFYRAQSDAQSSFISGVPVVPNSSTLHAEFDIAEVPADANYARFTYFALDPAGVIKWTQTPFSVYDGLKYQAAPIPRIDALQDAIFGAGEIKDTVDAHTSQLNTLIPIVTGENGLLHVTAEAVESHTANLVNINSTLAGHENQITAIQGDLDAVEETVLDHGQTLIKIFPDALLDGGFDTSFFSDGYVINTSTGERFVNSNYSASTYIPLSNLTQDGSGKKWISYTRLHTTGTSALFGIAFYKAQSQEASSFISGIGVVPNSSTLHAEIEYAEVPAQANYARFTYFALDPAGLVKWQQTPFIVYDGTKYKAALETRIDVLEDSVNGEISETLATHTSQLNTLIPIVTSETGLLHTTAATVEDHTTALSAVNTTLDEYDTRISDNETDIGGLLRSVRLSTVEDTDANNISDNKYYVYGSSDVPAASHVPPNSQAGTIIPIFNNANNSYQLGIDYSKVSLSIRGKKNGTWGDWKKFAFNDDFPAVLEPMVYHKSTGYPNLGITDSLEVYVPIGDFYVEYYFHHYVSSDQATSFRTKKCNVWKLDSIYINSFYVSALGAPVFTRVKQVTAGGELECAVRLSGREFVGGSAHGYEEMDITPCLFIDGKLITDLTTIDTIRTFNEIRFLRTSTLYDEQNETVEIAKHGCEYVINSDGLRINQSLKWLGAYDLLNCFLAMFTPAKIISGEVITDHYYTDKDVQPVDVSEESSYAYYFDGVKRAVVYGENSGLLCDFSIEKYPTGITGGDQFSITDNSGQNYNKMYYYIASTGARSSVGEIWNSTSVYKISYSQP